MPHSGVGRPATPYPPPMPIHVIEKGACRSEYTSLPPQAWDVGNKLNPQAKEQCIHCPVIADCAAWAAEHRPMDVIYAARAWATEQRRAISPFHLTGPYGTAKAIQAGNVDCEHCGGKYTRIRSHQKYCSRQCNREAYAASVRVGQGETDCEVCGVHFQKANHNQRFCSKKCLSRHNLDVLKANRVRKPKTKVTCRECGETWLTHRDQAEYCSDRCRNKAKNRDRGPRPARKVDLVDKPCERCGKVFRQACGIQRFCSTDCQRTVQHAAYAEKTKAARQEKLEPLRQRTCKQCEQGFRAEGSRPTTAVYCSVHCRKQAYLKRKRDSYAENQEHHRARKRAEWQAKKEAK